MVMIEEWGRWLGCYREIGELMGGVKWLFINTHTYTGTHAHTQEEKF